jgi:hypothetical protein
MPRPVAQFLERFVVPLVRGGEIHVGKPISAGELVQFSQDLAHASEPLVAADEARTAAVAELVVRPPSFVLDEDDLHIAAALHNLLFLEHPRVDSWMVPTGRLERVRETAQRFAARPRATDRYRLLARHGLLHNIFDITRTDLKIRWWTGSASYYGQPPPARLTRWKSLRRVSEETSKARYSDLLGDPDVEPIVGELLRLTPLTDLLSQPREGPPLDWDGAVVVLRDAELARAVAYHALRDASTEASLSAPARYAGAFERYLERNPPAEDVRAVASFLVHLNALIAVAESRDRDPDAPSPLLTSLLAPERAARRPRGLGTFFALPDALRKVDPVLAMPPGILEDDRFARRWKRHRKQVRDALSDAVRDNLTSRLRKALAL